MPHPTDKDHYQEFDALYGTKTPEEHLPSLYEKTVKGHCMPYSPSTQTAKYYINSSEG